MPNPMNPQEIFELAGLLSQMRQDQIDELIIELRREQPDLYDYFQSLHRLFPDSREYNEIMGVGYTIWQILKRSANPPGRVTSAMLRHANEVYGAELKRTTTGPPEARKQAVAETALAHPEPAMLLYLAVVMKQMSPGWGEKTVVLAANVLRVLIDALLAARGKAGRPAVGVEGEGRSKGQKAGYEVPEGPGPVVEGSTGAPAAPTAPGEEATSGALTERQVLELVWQVCEMPEDRDDALLDELREEQPEILDYLADLEDEFPDPREHKAVLGMAITIWLIMKHSPNPPGRVTEKMIPYAMMDYYDQAERLRALPPAARKKAAAEAARNHPEPAVLKHIALMLREKQNPRLTLKSQRRAKYLLRVLLDALIAARGEEARSRGQEAGSKMQDAGE
jgi:hypothetical protein